MPQDFHVREIGITTGHGGVRAPSTSSNPTASLRRHPPNLSSKETPARYATRPTQTRYDPRVEIQSLNNFMGGRPSYSREPEQPPKRFSPANTARNVSSTSSPNSLPSRQQWSHNPGFPSTSARSNDSVPYTERIQPAGSKISQDPRLPHECRPEYPVSDNRSRQFPDITQDIDWEAYNQILEHTIEKIYADDAKNRAESYPQTGQNNIAMNVAPDDPAEEGDESSVSSDESDLTDSNDSDEEIDVWKPMDNPSISHGVNNYRTVPYAEDLRRADGAIPVNSSSSGTRSGQKPSVSWGQAYVYPIHSKVVQQRNRIPTQAIRPRSALKR